MKVLNILWAYIEPVLELAIYIGISMAISKIIGITNLQAIFVVFVYFVLCVARSWLEKK